MLIDSEWVGSSDGKYENVINPATEDTIAQVPSATLGDVDKAVKAAHKAFREWSQKPLGERKDLLYKSAEIVEKRASEISRYLSMEQGKPLKQAIEELKNAANVLRYFAEEIFRVYGEIIPLPRKEYESITIWQPVGVVAAITPWNYPVQLLSWKVGAALAAGCTLIAKPPSYTPISPIKFIECLHDAGIPHGVVNIITGPGRTVGEALISHPLVRKVSFTGSTDIGKHVMELCASNLKRVTLELGGQTPMIVFEDADLEKAVKGAVRRSFRNMGQICNAVNRIFVEKKIYDKFVELFVEETKKLKIGDPLKEPDVDLGPMCNKEALSKVIEHVEDAVKKGAKILIGGKRPDGEKFKKGYWYEPTIIVNVNHDMEIMKEETFGPAKPVMPFNTINEVIEMANSTRYGLAAYVYTNNLNKAWKLSRMLDAGNIGINNVDVSTIEAPYPGWKESGIGCDLGREGLKHYLEVKHIKVYYDIT
ncbi:MAG: NAD-dependent succinate-semialdehyde dehydrogenase [Candidatus Caldarchaeales archaeon]